MWKKSLDTLLLLLAKKVFLLHPCSVMHPFKIASHLLPRWASFVTSLTTADHRPHEPSSLTAVFRPPRESPTEGPGEHKQPPPHPPGPQSLSSALAFRVLFPYYFLGRWHSGAERGGRSLLLRNDLPCPQRGVAAGSCVPRSSSSSSSSSWSPSFSSSPLAAPPALHYLPRLRVALVRHAAAAPSRPHQRAGAALAYRAAPRGGRSARPVSMAPAERAGAGAPAPF